jgi:carbon-monoxide dehydrogenase small subunit
MEITVTINGTERSFDVEPWVLLADFIRTQAGLTGTHIGCDTTSCGVCTVLLDGTPVKACTLFAVQADGRTLTTVEGLAQNGELHPVQEAFKECHGLQCGFCTPAMMLVGAALLDEKPEPTEDEIRWALSGNLCRCTGYMNIVKSIQVAAQSAAGAAAAPATDEAGG